MLIMMHGFSVKRSFPYIFLRMPQSRQTILPQSLTGRYVIRPEQGSVNGNTRIRKEMENEKKSNIRIMKKKKESGFFGIRERDCCMVIGMEIQIRSKKLKIG